MKGLSNLSLTDTAVLTLAGPSGQKLLLETGEMDEAGKPKTAQVTITLLRKDSKEATRFAERAQQNRLDRSAKKGRLKLSAKELRQEATDLLVYCTRGWENFTLDGETMLDCTAANVRAVYEDEKFSWIREQVSDFITDEEAYLGNSSTS